MILFHGTNGSSIESIRKVGLKTPSLKNWSFSWWAQEIGQPPSVFLSNQPKAGVGSSPIEFAQAGDGDGYLVILDLSQAELTRRLRGIWTTHDIDMYYDLKHDIDSYYFECLGRAGSFAKTDSLRVLDWIKDKYPRVAGRLCIRDGFTPIPNGFWLGSKIHLPRIVKY